MEYIEGGDLANRIKKQKSKRFPEDDAFNIVRDCLLGLKHLHSKKIAHRDIKLENIVYDEKADRAKLIDFGLSKIFRVGQA